MEPRYTLTDYQKKWLEALTISEDMCRRWLYTSEENVVLRVIRYGKYTEKERDVLNNIAGFYTTQINSKPFGVEPKYIIKIK